MAYNPVLPVPAYSNCLSFYNGNSYAPGNLGGMANNGHVYNFIPALQDMCALAAFAAQMAQVASTYAAGTNGWTSEASTIVFVDASSFKVAGNKVAQYEQGRALAITQGAPGFCFIGTAAWDGSTWTTVTIKGLVLTSDLSAVALGQAVENAPAAGSSIGSDLYIQQNYFTLGGF